MYGYVFAEVEWGTASAIISAIGVAIAAVVTRFVERRKMLGELVKVQAEVDLIKSKAEASMIAANAKAEETRRQAEFERNAKSSDMREGGWKKLLDDMSDRFKAEQAKSEERRKFSNEQFDIIRKEAADCRASEAALKERCRNLEEKVARTEHDVEALKTRVAESAKAFREK